MSDYCKHIEVNLNLDGCYYCYECSTKVLVVSVKELEDMKKNYSGCILGSDCKCKGWVNCIDWLLGKVKR